MKTKLLTILTFTIFAFTANAQWALNFDGGVGPDAETQSWKYADDATTSIMDGATNYTIEVWVKPTNTDNADIHNKVILKQWNLFALTMFTDGSAGSYANPRVYFTAYTDAGSKFVNTNLDVLTIGVWQHIAVICDATAGTIKIYINGVDVTNDTETAADVILKGGNANDNLYCGYGGSGTYPQMQARGIRIKNVAESIGNLNTTDVKTSPYTTDANTAALFYFKEGTGIVTNNEASSTDANFGFGTPAAHFPTWVDLSTLSVNKFNTTSFNLYPNPAVDNTFIIQTKNSESLQKVEMFNILGKLVKTIAFNDNVFHTNINAKNLNAGIYIVKIKTDTGVGIQKLIIK